MRHRKSIFFAGRVVVLRAPLSIGAVVWLFGTVVTASIAAAAE